MECNIILLCVAGGPESRYSSTHISSYTLSTEQIMAIGTLAECYNNINVFRGVVKIRRG